MASPAASTHIRGRAKCRAPCNFRIGPSRSAAGGGHTEHRRAASEGGTRSARRDRGARHCAVGAVLELQRPPTDGRDARSCAGGRGRSAVCCVRRNRQERHDPVRARPRSVRRRTGDDGRAACRPRSCRWLDTVGVPGGKRCAAGEGGWCQGGHRQRRTHEDGPPRRCGADRAALRTVASAVRRGADSRC